MVLLVAVTVVVTTLIAWLLVAWVYDTTQQSLRRQQAERRR